MKVMVITLMVFALAGCATAPRQREASTGPCYPSEYDIVRLAPSAGAVKSPAAREKTRHTIRPGDTLWSISKMYNVDIDELASVNSIRDTDSIEKGRVLVIPSAVSGGSYVKTARPVRRAQARADSFVWPVNGEVISRFGSKVDSALNKGIDIRASEGTSVVSSRSGKVVYRDSQLKGFGQTIIIDHGDGYQTVYSYNSAILVNVGDDVRQRDAIAKVGSSGRAKEPTLHFEIRRNGEPHNPEFYLSKR